MEVELEDVPVHNLVPEPLRGDVPVSEFMAALPEYDGDMTALLEEAEAAGECLRFVGASSLVDGPCRCALIVRRCVWGVPYASHTPCSGFISRLLSRMYTPDGT